MRTNRFAEYNGWTIEASPTIIAAQRLFRSGVVISCETGERFVFTGPVPDAELAAYYRASSVYISLSEHEGFCVPLLEAMAMDVPVLAYGTAAVPDTLGGAGIQFAPKDLEYAAELMGMLAFEDHPREEVLAGQRKRLEDFSDHVIQQRLSSVISTF